MAIDNLATPTAMLLQALRRYRSNIAFRDDDSEVSYAAVEAMLGGMQHVLVRRGVRPGDTVAILASNRWTAWCAGAAVQALGATECWLHPLGSLSTHAEQLVQSGAAFVVVDAATFPGRLEELEALTPFATFLLMEDSAESLVTVATAEGSVPARDASVKGSIGALSFTGGTTGKAKAVERPVSALSFVALATLAGFDLPARPNYLAVGPISHVTGTKILPVLMRGGTVSLMKGFDPERALHMIAGNTINVTLMVPTMIYGLLDTPRLAQANLSSLELVLYGASPMSPARLAEGLARIGPVFAQLYGQSECYPIAVLPRHDHDPAMPSLLAACGLPLPGMQVALLDDALGAVGEGEVGEICVRGPAVMRRYRGAPEATAEAFRGDWLHTGDLARCDDGGRLYIVDRKRDLIISGGFNVYPREIEDVLSALPGVAAAAVFGTPHPRWGEAVHAVVTARPGAALDEAAMIAAVRVAKGRVASPKRIEIADSLPLTAAGKVDKKQLRARFWTDAARQVG